LLLGVRLRLYKWTISNIRETEQTCRGIAQLLRRAAMWLPSQYERPWAVPEWMCRDRTMPHFLRNYRPVAGARAGPGSTLGSLAAALIQFLGDLRVREAGKLAFEQRPQLFGALQSLGLLAATVVAHTAELGTAAPDSRQCVFRTARDQGTPS
jgi:hypothetical protein